ncbi:MAG: 30S ribosomal protein S18 [Chloroflexi bacterium]|nr:30S ribosomal protein S18 [Chloroflexota bacterium]
MADRDFREEREERFEGRASRRTSRDEEREEHYEERTSRRRSSAGGARGGAAGRRRRRLCQFCVDGVDHIDYKDVTLLRQYLSPSARILSRRRTGTCAKHQRMLAAAIKRARQIALLPYTAEHVRLTGSGGAE